jgi:NAD(P)-dependent dehydrogenase (short-subunit alcohol dehydrogenase family)
MSLKDKNVVVTGGSRGLGLGLSKRSWPTAPG